MTKDLRKAGNLRRVDFPFGDDYSAADGPLHDGSAIDVILDTALSKAPEFELSATFSADLARKLTPVRFPIPWFALVGLAVLSIFLLSTVLLIWSSMTDRVSQMVDVVSSVATDPQIAGPVELVLTIAVLLMLISMVVRIASRGALTGESIARPRGWSFPYRKFN